MANERPAFLSPRLRLFLSVDLVGSTALKQVPRYPLPTPDKLTGDIALTPWLSPIADFYREFMAVFEREWKPYPEAIFPDLGVKSSTFPELWKANGDELIYVLEVSDRRQLYGCVQAWVKALQAYRYDRLKDRKLDIKSTGWTAGFPVANAEVVFRRNVGGEPSVPPDYPGDSRLRQMSLLDLWYAGKHEDLLRDFLGPAMDTGFRLGALATPRKMMLSIELAYFLAILPKVDKQFKWFKVGYSGRKVLKGVLGERPYPLFWIDTYDGNELFRVDNEINNIEDEIGHENVDIHRDMVQRFCNAFFDKEERYIFKPFVFEDLAGTEKPELPRNYDIVLDHWAEKFRLEKEKYAAEVDDLRIKDDAESLAVEVSPEATNVLRESKKEEIAAIVLREIVKFLKSSGSGNS